ncbi:MAG: transposase, partial [Ignavibacteria bacterium]|nr:transposase [Ignavibacteria bacterium]
MFVRLKTNKSGKKSIQVNDKSTGKYKVVKTIGCSSSSTEVERLKKIGYQWIKESNKQIEIDFLNELQVAEDYLNRINQIKVKGTDLLLGKKFDEIGFGSMNE